MSLESLILLGFSVILSCSKKIFLFWGVDKKTEWCYSGHRQQDSPPTARGLRELTEREKTMKENMILVMIDECGDEIEVDRYALQLDLDEDELEVWKDRKIRKASERFPEARGFAGMLHWM